MNTWSVEGGTGWYSVLLGQNRAVLVASMMSFQKIYGLHGLNHQIIEYSKKEKVITDRQTDTQTDRISSCRLDPFCRRGRVKTHLCHSIISSYLASPKSICFLGILTLLRHFEPHQIKLPPASPRGRMWWQEGGVGGSFHNSHS